MDSGNDKGDIYTEKLMNMILDAIDDIIIIHDSQHTVIWMNRAAEKAFGRSVDDVIGVKCYTLFGNTVPCSDCTVNLAGFGGPAVVRRLIPSTGKRYDCSTIPYFEDGQLRMVVQHLRETPSDAGQCL